MYLIAEDFQMKCLHNILLELKDSIEYHMSHVFTLLFLFMYLVFSVGLSNLLPILILVSGCGPLVCLMAGRHCT